MGNEARQPLAGRVLTSMHLERQHRTRRTKEAVKRLAILALVALCIGYAQTAAADEPEPGHTLHLENGILLHVEAKKRHRYMPHVFYDQAVATIPQIYPESRFLVKRRYGQLGESQYSIVCYKPVATSQEVVITGFVTSKQKAWLFDTRIADNQFPEGLLIVLEAVSAIPSNAQLARPEGNNH